MSQTFSSDIAFTPTVKALQAARGSRAAYAKMEQKGAWRTKIDDELRLFLSQQRSAYFATANALGQPYIQHRGGPPGFLRALDDHTIGFADFSGNRQYISLGNLEENSQAHLFLMDYALRRRIKIWGRARVAENDPALIAALAPDNYRAKPERAILLEVLAWDVNCPQHIPQRYEAGDVERALADKDRRIARLEAALAEAQAKQAS